MWIAVLALKRKVGEVCLATWIEVSAVPTDLITFRNPTPCPTLAPEDTAGHLQITTIILLTQRSAEEGASTADFSWTPRKHFRQMLDIKFLCCDAKP